jgi:hypothetical protein
LIVEKLNADHSDMVTSLKSDFSRNLAKVVAEQSLTLR